MILLYCIVASTASVIAPASGVRGSKVDSLLLVRQRCFFSELAAEAATALTKDDALDFHQVVKQIFSQATVIPFRFPTLLRSQEELAAYLKKNASSARRSFEKIDDAVQMELRIAISKQQS